MKLFQIEEPEGSPLAQEGPGAAVGIDLSPDKGAAVAISIGGNAELLPGSDGARRLLAGAPLRGKAAVAELLLALRARAEKALLRPVTHAVVVAAGEEQQLVAEAAPEAGLTLLRIVDRAAAAAAAGNAAPADGAVLGAAILAEDEAMRREPR